jgi:serine/threonine-protein kinase
MSDTATLTPGSPFGRYVIQRALGSGAFGAVYEAIQQPLGKRVALKVLHAAQLHNADALRRFTAEAEATAKLRHPHIVDVIDLGAHEGVPYIAMEFLEGESLGERLHREGRLSTRAAVDLLLPVLSAVATVHDAAIVHRDLKPDNIFLAVVRPGKVQAKLLDFGIAKVKEAQNSLTRTGTMMGTVIYMSPEQARESKDVDGRSDQWAMGVILYECITGRCPFPGEAMIDVLTGIIAAPVPPMSDVAGLPAGIEAILGRAMSKDRDQRYESVRAMAAELSAYASATVRDEWATEFAMSAVDADDGFQATINSKSLVPGASAPSAAATLLKSVSIPGQEISVTRHSVEIATPVVGGRKSHRGAITAVAALATVVVVAAMGFAVGDNRGVVRPAQSLTQVATPYVVTVEVVPATARVEVDGETLGSGQVSRSFPRDGRHHRMRVSASGYVASEFDFDAERRPAERIELTAVPVPIPEPVPMPVVLREVVARPAPGLRPRPAAAVRRPRVPVAGGGEEVGGGVTSSGIEIH